LSTGSDCNLCYKHVLPNRQGNVKVGGTGVLIKWQILGQPAFLVTLR
jgi:hypothetical protein